MQIYCWVLGRKNSENRSAFGRSNGQEYSGIEFWVIPLCLLLSSDGRQRGKIYIVSNSKPRYRLLTKHDTEGSARVVVWAKKPVQRRRRKGAKTIHDQLGLSDVMNDRTTIARRWKTTPGAPVYPRLRVNENYPGYRRPCLASIKRANIVNENCDKTSNYDRLQAAKSTIYTRASGS